MEVVPSPYALLRLQTVAVAPSTTSFIEDDGSKVVLRNWHRDYVAICIYLSRRSSENDLQVPRIGPQVPTINWEFKESDQLVLLLYCATRGF